MTCRPILMSGEMVRALLDGRKTQTRRIIKRPLKHPGWTGYSYFPLSGVAIENGPDYPDDDSDMIVCPYGRAGDSLWVRETWRVANKLDGIAPGALPFDRGLTIMYAAGGSRAHNGAGIYENDYAYPPEMPIWAGKRRPSIHMPRWASRITLKITEVRVQQLSEISHQDCEAEGWPGPDEANTIARAYPMAWYSTLWDSINGKGSWMSSPWVWALTFEVQ